MCVLTEFVGLLQGWATRLLQGWAKCSVADISATTADTASWVIPLDSSHHSLSNRITPKGIPTKSWTTIRPTAPPVRPPTRPSHSRSLEAAPAGSLMPTPTLPRPILQVLPSPSPVSTSSPIPPHYHQSRQYHPSRGPVEPVRAAGRPRPTAPDSSSPPARPLPAIPPPVSSVSSKSRTPSTLSRSPVGLAGSHQTPDLTPIRPPRPHLRPHQRARTASRPICKVNLPRAPPVLRSEMSREPGVS